MATLVFLTDDNYLEVRDALNNEAVGYRNGRFYDKHQYEPAEKVILTSDYPEIQADYEANDIPVLTLDDYVAEKQAAAQAIATTAADRLAKARAAKAAKAEAAKSEG